jgi:hypothetical protein
MKLILLLLMVGFTLVMVFVGSNDAARWKEDQEKYGGDELIKAISEYNEKSSKLRGPVGSVGVTRTPLSSDYDKRNNPRLGNSGYNNSRKNSSQMPDYMLSTPPEARGYYPPNPYAPQSPGRKRSFNSDSRSEGSRGNDSYYPPAPVPENNNSGQEDNYYPPRSENRAPFTIPMTLPKQPVPEHLTKLRSGQKVFFAGTTVYTYDKEGNPMPLPDGKYQVGKVEIYVKGGEQVLSQ